MSSEPRVRLLVSCGEASGDLYAAELVRRLRGTRQLEVFGLGGDRLAREGAQLLAHVRELAVVGLFEVLRHLKRLRRALRDVIAAVEADPPAAAVLVDYPDFNLRLAGELRRRGVPVVYYVSPQIWAWRPGRLRTIRERVSHMMVIFPFEEKLYREAGVPVTFVGHPLVELVEPAPGRSVFLAASGLDPGRPVLAILPGSRAQEVRHNLPPIAGALRRLKAARPGLQLALAVAPNLAGSLFEQELSGLEVVHVQGQTHALMSAARAGIVASGTATVEAAILGLPMVVVYRLSSLTYALGRPLVRVPHYAMANLIAGRQVVKELIQHNLREDTLAIETLRLLEDEAYRREVRAGLDEVRDRLGAKGASARAATVVEEVLSRSKKR